MMSYETTQLLKLDSIRIKSTYVFLLLALFLMAGAGQIPALSRLYSGFHFILPFLAGILFSVGIIADDLQQRTWPTILSLPISRSRFWNIRVAGRFMLFLTFLALWRIVPVYFPLETLPWSVKTTPYTISFVAGLLAFAMGLFFTNLMRNTFESAIAAECCAVILIVVLRNTANELIGFVLTLITLIIITVAARKLFLCREPLEFTALVSRAAAWILILAAVITLPAILF